MMNELKKVGEIKNYFRGMKSAKKLSTKRQCLENIKRISNELNVGVIGLDYFISKYENAKRFYKKDIDGIMKNVESAIEVLKEEIKKENEEKAQKNKIIVNVTKEDIIKDLHDRAQKNYESYVLDNEYDERESMSYDDFYYKRFDCIEYYLIKIHDTLTETKKIDVHMFKTLFFNDEEDENRYNLTIEMNDCDKEDIEIVLYDTKYYNWFWITAKMNNDILNFYFLDKNKDNQITNGVLHFKSIEYFEID